MGDFTVKDPPSGPRSKLQKTYPKIKTGCDVYNGSISITRERAKEIQDAADEVGRTRMLEKSISRIADGVKILLAEVARLQGEVEFWKEAFSEIAEGEAVWFKEQELRNRK